MHIAMLSVHANPLAELSSALVRAGHEVTVHTRRDDPAQPASHETAQGYRVVHVPAGPARPVPEDELLPHLGEFTRFVDQQWREAPPDVVHSHFWMSGIVAVLAGKRHRIPVVHTYQGTADARLPQRIGIERKIGRAAARVIATCTDEVGELTRMGVPRERVRMVPWGVDCAQFRPEGPAPRKRWPRRVVSVGGLVPRKGFADLIMAMRGVPDTELVIAGGPPRDELAADPEAVRLRELAERLRVADRVRLVGRVPRNRMPALLRSADLVACAPWHEPFGIVSLEAMACGVPVLATRVDALVDTVVEDVTGVLVPPRRPVALRTAMNALLADPVRRSFLGSAGRDRAEQRYPWQRIAEESALCYEHCVERVRTPLAGSPL